MGGKWSSNLGRARTKFGAWLDNKGLSQNDIQKLTRCSRSTLAMMCGDVNYRPSDLLQRTIVSILISEGYDVDTTDFW